MVQASSLRLSSRCVALLYILIAIQQMNESNKRGLSFRAQRGISNAYPF